MACAAAFICGVNAYGALVVFCKLFIDACWIALNSCLKCRFLGFCMLAQVVFARMHALGAAFFHGRQQLSAVACAKAMMTMHAWC